MKKRIFGKFFRNCLIAGIVSLLIMLFLMAICGIAPFGNNNLLVNDSGAQYAQFLTAYRRAIIAHSIDLYSFSLGIGDNALPTVAYYLMSPLNLIFALFKVSSLPAVLTVLICIKIGLLASTMTYFLQRHFNTLTITAATFGVAFSLSGFVSATFFNIMWLDSYLLLPLVLDGVDVALKHGKYTRLYVWLSLSILFNYYIGYMTCLCVGIYLLYQVAEMTDQSLNFKNQLLNKYKDILKVLATGLASALTGSVILIPTALGMFKTTKVISTVNNYALWPNFGIHIFPKFFIGLDTITNRTFYTPAVFSTILVLILVISYFIHPEIKRKQKIHAATMLLILFLGMNIRLLNTVWHLFQTPIGFPYRQVFFVSFILIMLGFQVWQKGLENLPVKQKKLIAEWTIGIIGAFFIFMFVPTWTWKIWELQITRKKIIVLIVNLVVVGFELAFLLLAKKKIATLLAASFVVFEGTSNFWFSLKSTPLGDQSVYNTWLDPTADKLGDIPQSKELFRTVDTQNIAQYSQYYYYNHAVTLGIKGISSYNSTLNKDTRRALMHLGVYSQNGRRVSEIGLTPLVNSLLGVKYFIPDNGPVQTNPNYIGFGFLVNDQFTNIQLSPSKRTTNQGQILKAMDNKSQKYFVKAPAQTRMATRSTGGVNYPYLQTYQLKTQATGHVFLSATSKNGGIDYNSIMVNDTWVSNQVDAYGGNFLYDLGYFPKGSTLNIELYSQYSNPTLYFNTLDDTKLQSVLNSTKGFHPTYRPDHISGNIYVNPKSLRQWLFIPVAYDTGWEAIVNGKKVPTKQVLTNLTAIKLNPGENSILMKYHVPGLFAGGALSVIGIIGFCGFEYGYPWWKRRRKLN